jgi:acetate kinase
MEWLGISIDQKVNSTVHGIEKIISTTESKIKVVVIPTDEEFMIASDTMQIISQ